MTEYRATGTGGYELNHPLLGWIDERRISYSERPWRPFVQTEPHGPTGAVAYQFSEGETFWANSHYLVFMRPLASSTGLGEARHLSLRTVENDTRHDWRDFQRVKNELCGPDWEAVELYPAQSRVVDTANQYHLWAFSQPLGIGFTQGLVMDTERSGRTGAKQRRLPTRG